MIYVAFLRGLNLGKHRRVKNADLCACFEQMGFVQVSAFLASGNVIFESSSAPSKLEEGLQEALGFDVPVFLRSANEVRELAALDPFGSEGKVQVIFLHKKAPASVLELATDEDRLAIHGRQVFWLPRGGMSGSSLDFKAVEGEVGPTTVRTKRTVERLAERLPG